MTLQPTTATSTIIHFPTTTTHPIHQSWDVQIPSLEVMASHNSGPQLHSKSSAIDAELILGSEAHLSLNNHIPLSWHRSADHIHHIRMNLQRTRGCRWNNPPPPLESTRRLHTCCGRPNQAHSEAHIPFRKINTKNRSARHAHVIEGRVGVLLTETIHRLHRDDPPRLHTRGNDYPHSAIRCNHPFAHRTWNGFHIHTGVRYARSDSHRVSI